MDFQVFIQLHSQQLISSGVPDIFWEILFYKLKNQIFDAGEVLELLQIDYENNTPKPSDPLWLVQVKLETGIKKIVPNNIYLVDHAWTYRPENAKTHLRTNASLVERFCVLMGISENLSMDEKINQVFKEMWRHNQTYSIQNTDNIEDRLPIWYITDELGFGIQHSDDPNFRMVPFIYQGDDVSYSLLFPIKDVDCGEIVTRNYVERENDPLRRKALLVPWNDETFLDVDFKQEEPDAEYFAEGHIDEELPNIEDFDLKKNGVEPSKRLKVYSEYKYVNRFLNDPYFEIVDNSTEADILWLTHHFKKYKQFGDENPQKFINQFPYEFVITIKDLLAIICRRKAGEFKYNAETLETYPDWIPTTFNLSTELPKFISYFQHREKCGFDNTWICKPYNLARGLDTHITDNLNQIIRVSTTGPKIVQKYINDPVLFNRPEINGKVKFDVRYVILVQSVKPLQVFVYKNFFIRFANEAFSLDDFDVYEKHFTVMNYSNPQSLRHMRCSEFLNEWKSQYVDYDWSAIESEIIDIFRDVFEAALEKESPCGIVQNKQSRALYAADVMLEWKITSDGEKVMRPKLLEINWAPDCKRACMYYSNFYNDIFSLLFLGMVNDRVFKQI